MLGSTVGFVATLHFFFCFQWECLHIILEFSNSENIFCFILKTLLPLFPFQCMYYSEEEEKAPAKAHSLGL